MIQLRSSSSFGWFILCLSLYAVDTRFSSLGRSSSCTSRNGCIIAWREREWGICPLIIVLTTSSKTYGSMVDVLTRICGSNISVSLANLISVSNWYWRILWTLIVRNEVSSSSIIDPYSLASILIGLMSASSKCTLKVWHIVSCVCKLILSTIKTKVFGHTIPLLIELVRLLAS